MRVVVITGLRTFGVSVMCPQGIQLSGGDTPIETNDLHFCGRHFDGHALMFLVSLCFESSR